MSTFQKVQSWITEGAAFPPLDEDGYSGFAPASGGMIYLHVSPAEEAPVLLYAPLISLEGLGPAAQLEFLWDLAEDNIVGELPSTYRFFADRDNETVYLGCQFDVESLDRAGFFALLDAFVRYAGVEREEMRARLDAVAAEEEETVEDGSAPAPVPTDTVRPQLSFLRI